MANTSPLLRSSSDTPGIIHRPDKEHVLLDRRSSHVAFAQGRSTVKSKTQRGSKAGQTIKLGRPGGSRQNAGVRQTSRGQKSSGGGRETDREASQGSQFYFNFTGFPFPLGPLLKRPTVRTEVSLLSSSRALMSEINQASCLICTGA